MNRRELGRMMAGAAAAMAVPGWAQGGPKGVRFSFMLWAIEKPVGFDRAVEMVAEAGYQGIELTGEFQKWTPEERTRVMAKLRRLGLVVDSMSGVRAAFAVPEERELFVTQFAEHLKFAKELECPQVILLSGRRSETLSMAEQRVIVIENLKRAAEMAAKEKVEIVIEPIDFIERPNVFLASVTDGFEIAAAVNAPNLKVLYDLYHEQRSFGNLIEKLEKNIGRVGLIHVAEVPGRHEPGTGEIDFGPIYRKLRELKYDRWIAMEFYPTEETVVSLKKARLGAEKELGVS